MFWGTAAFLLFTITVTFATNPGCETQFCFNCKLHLWTGNYLSTKPIAKNVQYCIDSEFDNLPQPVTKILIEKTVKHIGKQAFERLKNVVVINGTNIKLEKIEPYAFYNLKNLKHVYLQKNMLTTISNNTFVDIPVQQIYLSENQITTIDKAAFSNLPNLKQLHLSRNKLSMIDPDWFYNTNGIEILHFAHNNIESIDDYTFDCLEDLKQLFLNDNRIVNVSNVALDNTLQLLYLNNNFVRNIKFLRALTGLRYLKLDNNHIMHIRKNMLPRVPRTFLRNFTMKNNPFKCSCYWKFILQDAKFARQVFVNDDGPECVSPINGHKCDDEFHMPSVNLYHIAMKQHLASK